MGRLGKPEEVAALAAYVASLAPGPRAYTNEEIKWERDGNTADGGELFRNNCAMCHNFAGQGGALTQGKYAPTVMGVEPRHICHRHLDDSREEEMTLSNFFSS